MHKGYGTKLQGLNLSPMRSILGVCFQILCTWLGTDIEYCMDIKFFRCGWHRWINFSQPFEIHACICMGLKKLQGICRPLWFEIWLPDAHLEVLTCFKKHFCVFIPINFLIHLCEINCSVISMNAMQFSMNLEAWLLMNVITWKN